jgi:Protein of unknown function (DUF760)
LLSCSYKHELLLQAEGLNAMDNLTNQEFNLGDTTGDSALWQYVQAMEPETIAQISRPSSPEVMEMMERHIISMLGALPGDQFGVMITTSRENLGRLMAASMMNGYFLKAAEQRMTFEQSFQALDYPSQSSDNPPSAES